MKKNVIIVVLILLLGCTGVAGYSIIKHNSNLKQQTEALNTLQEEQLARIGAVESELATEREALGAIESTNAGLAETVKELKDKLAIKPREVIRTVTKTETVMHCPIDPSESEDPEVIIATRPMPVDVEITTTIAKVETAKQEAHILGESRAVVSTKTNPPQTLLDASAPFDHRTQFLEVEQEEPEDKGAWWIGLGVTGAFGRDEFIQFEEGFDIASNTSLGVEGIVIKEFRKIRFLGKWGAYGRVGSADGLNASVGIIKRFGK